MKKIRIRGSGQLPLWKKCFRLMKLTFLFMMMGLMQISASVYSQTAKLKLNMRNARVIDVLEQIEKQSEFRFAYSAALIDMERKVTVSVDEKNIGETLDALFAGTEVKHVTYDRHIMLYPQELDAPSITEIQQQNSISGKVTDSSGQPLPGVTVLLKGTTQGTVTNTDGEYSLSIIPANATLQFSFVGMTTQEIVVGSQTNIDVVMEETAVGIDEIVVTAFGIAREKKRVSYSIQKVGGEQLAATGNNDILKGLQGKVAGVTVKQLSGAPGSEPKVTIRGSNSITGNNSPLYVVDGFPIEGGASNNIDPNEIENISVLKGAAASALYGLRASAGVILISTKRGKGLVKNKPTVTTNSNYSFDELSVYPKTQKIYGQGENKFQSNSAFSWGLKISEMGTYINQLGEEEVARAYDNTRDFFKTGGTLNSNINISNNFDMGNYSIGTGYSGQKGIVPNTDFERVSVKLAGDYQISDKIKVGTLVNYSVAGGTRTVGGNSSLFFAAFGAPPSYNLKGKPTHVEGNEYQQINYRGSHDNIYWGVEHNKLQNTVSSLITSIDFDYSPAKWLNFNYRIGINEQMDEELIVYELGSGATGGRTNPPSGGELTKSMDQTRSINSTFIASVKKNINEKLDFDFMVGHEFYDYNGKGLTTTGNDLTIGGFHDLTNASSITSDEYWNRRRSYAFFSSLDITYNNILFLTLTGRNDVVSNMPRNDRSFFYPSAGLGFIFTETMKNRTGPLSFGKVQVNYAEVGQAGRIYSTVLTYGPGSAGNFQFPFNGVNAFTLSNSLKSTDLRPENTKSLEVGINLGFLENRVNLDYAYYYSKSDGQIFAVPVSTSTGFSTETRNAGEMLNNGHEIILNVKPIVTDNFNWNFTTNFTTYVSKVEKLYEGIDMLTLGSAGEGVSSIAKEGEEYPVLWGTGYARDTETGKIVVDSRETLPNGSVNPSYGMPLRSTGNIVLGKADPDFEVNFLNTFKYKRLTFYAQVDWRQGGKLYSGDSRLTKLYGTHYDTQFREEDYVEDAIKGYYDNSGKLITEGQNDIVIKRGYQYYRRVGDSIRESVVYDSSFIRLREVRISYDLPVGFLKRYYITGASVYTVGRNLWLIKSGLPYFDPEMSNTNGNAIGGTYIDYPQISNYGFGINLTF